MILKVIGILLVLFGVVLIYDARKITRDLFSFGDQNEGTLGLKMVGTILALVGAITIYFNI